MSLDISSGGEMLPLNGKVCFWAWFTATHNICPLTRLEFPDGLGLPVSQLASVCAGVCVPVRRRHRIADHHAGEPTLLPGGEWRPTSKPRLCCFFHTVGKSPEYVSKWKMALLQCVCFNRTENMMKLGWFWSRSMTPTWGPRATRRGFSLWVLLDSPSEGRITLERKWSVEMLISRYEFEMNYAATLMGFHLSVRTGVKLAFMHI